MQTLGSVSVGSIVKIKENGSPVDFYVAKHDYESGLNGAGRTLVVRKDTYDDRVWDAGSVNAYASSDLDSWFNSTYKNMLDADIRSLIGTTKIRYTPGNGNWTVGTLERAIFALSATELGWSVQYANTEGSALPIWESLRIAYQNGSPTGQWTRSPYTDDTNHVIYLRTDGVVNEILCVGLNGARPVFPLPGASVYVDDNNNVVTNQPPTAPGTITVPSAGSKGGSLTVSWTASTDPDGNLSGYTLQRMVDSGSWTQVYQGANTSFTDTLPATANSVQYRVQAYDAAGATSDWTTSSSVPVYGSPKLTVPIQAMQGQQVSVSWTGIDGADSYILQRKSNTDSDFTQVYAGEALTFSETAGTWTSVQYRVCAVFGSTNGAWATSGSIPVVSASALVVSGSDGDLGTLTSDVEYTVSSDGTNPITVEEDVNGTVRTFTAVNGGTNVIPVVDLPTGTGTITIKATTQATAGEVTVTRSWTYAKGAPVFSDSGSLAQLQQQGANIWPKTIAEAIRTPGIWGGNLGLALQKLAGAVLYNRTQQAKYAEVTVDLSAVSVGEEVNLPYNGIMVPHIVGHIGNPDSSLYDASCDGVWLLRKDIAGNGQWNNSGVNTLSGSAIMSTIAGYMADYENVVKAAIKTVKIPYCIGGGNSAVNSGANGLECNLFPLSGVEVGFISDEDNPYQPNDGAKLDYFIEGESADANQRRKESSGVFTLRSPFTNGSSNVWVVDVDGGSNLGGASASYGLRYAFIMPTTFTATYLVADDGTIGEEQEYVPAGSFGDVQGNAVPVTRIETGSYVGTGTYGQANPNSLTFGFEPHIVLVSANGGDEWNIFMKNVGLSIFADNSYYNYPSFAGNGVSWYTNTNSVSYQFNVSGKTYYYVAIGLGGESA